MRGSQSVWLVIHLAHSAECAKRIEDMFRAEGLVVKTHPLYRNRSVQENLYEILVLKSEAQEAHDLLIEHGFMN